jgi:PAS domain S-box-containing protein
LLTVGITNVHSAPASRPLLFRYGLAIAAVGAALLLRGSLDRFLAEGLAFTIFAPAILIVSLVAGTGPGVLATILSALAGDYYFVMPRQTLKLTEVNDLVMMFTFVLIGLSIVWLSHKRNRAERARVEAVERAQHASIQARSATLFRSVLESAPDAVVTVDQAGRIIVVNSQTEGLFGYGRDEMLGQQVETLLPDDLRGRHGHHREGYAVDPRTRPMGAGLDLWGRRKDGSRFPAEISLSPLHTEEGLLVTAVVRDVTEKRRAQEERARLIREQAALAEAEAAQRRSAFLAEVTRNLASTLSYEDTLSRLARLMVPSLGDWCAVYITEDDNSIQPLAVAHVDPARVKWAEEVLARFPPDANASFGAPSVIRTGTPELYENIGESFWEERVRNPELARITRDLEIRSLMVVPLKARTRTIGAMSLAYTRESGRHYNRTELELANDVARRAEVAIENARLYKEAQEANRLKDEFLATLSHELRTPLSAVLGWARMLAMGRLDEATARRGIEAIERNAQAQVQLVNDLLDVSRIVSGKLRLEMAPVELLPIMAAAVDSVRPAAEARQLSIEVKVDQTVGPIMGDGDRLHQVLWNLLSNAVKFTPRLGHVWVSATSAGSHVDIQVRDTGKGIRPEFLPRVFERFSQADSGTTRAHGGLGLGLAIVRHIVEMHGGSVKAESGGEGQGATFSISLPAKVAAVSWPDSTSVMSDGGKAAVASLKGLRALLVDDDADARELLHAALAGYGMSVTLARSAQEALESFRASRPDIVITDIGMPEEDGYSLLARIRSVTEEGKRVPVVALTAYARAEDKRRVYAAGFDRHISKPVDPAGLAETLASLLASRY